jgi:phage terminase large subunit-like protein
MQVESDLVNFDAREARKQRRLIFSMYPETGPLRRQLYPKHMEFFGAGLEFRERCAMCANRVGKTVGMGGYELTCHLTGWYPRWWHGRRFRKPVQAIAAGKTSKTTREILQAKLLGKPVRHGPIKTVDGTGLIPGEWIGKPNWAEGIRDLVDTVRVKNLYGGYSTLSLKSYEQGTGAFEGTEKDVILLDEEPPLAIYAEALIRTASTTGRPEDNGIIILTFTPLEGMSDTVLSFVPAEMRPAVEEDKRTNGYS